MRKLILLSAVFSLMCATALAQNPAGATEGKSDLKVINAEANKADAKAVKTNQQTQKGDWEFFTLVFMPGAPSSSDHAITNGFRLGAPISAGVKGTVRGLEGAVFSCLTKNIQGVQSAPFYCGTDTITGIQFSMVNYAKESNGLQLGLVNYAENCSFQVGLVNFIDDGLLPFFPFVNVSF